MHWKFVMSRFIFLILALSIMTGPNGVSAMAVNGDIPNLLSRESADPTGGILYPQTIHFRLTTTTVGNGTVLANPLKTVYSSGETVTLIANADPGYYFRRLER